MRRFAPIIVILCCVIAGCGFFFYKKVATPKIEFNTEQVCDEVNDHLFSDGSQTHTMLLEIQQRPSYSAACQYVKEIHLTLDSQMNEDTLIVNYTITYPDIESIRKALRDSDTFLAEYNSVEDKEKCIYNYVTNTILSGEGIEFTTVSDSLTVSDQETAKSALKDELDSVAVNCLSSFALTTFYDGTTDETEESTIVPFLESHDLNDFVFKINKHRVQVSDISIKKNEEAIQALCDISPNNSLIALDANTNLYLVEYTMTNLTKKSITLSNYFVLGDAEHHLYENTGFHIEGQSTPQKIKYGKSATFKIALVGDAEAKLFFYDAEMYGARIWDEIPISKTEADEE